LAGFKLFFELKAFLAEGFDSDFIFQNKNLNPGFDFTFDLEPLLEEGLEFFIECEDSLALRFDLLFDFPDFFDFAGLLRDFLRLLRDFLDFFLFRELTSGELSTLFVLLSNGTLTLT
jgi:hypothetical protein